MRTQIDGLGDEYSIASSTSFDPDENMTRQEFRDDCDVNILLKRHGMDFPSRPLEYGEYDFDITLQSALEASRTASEAFGRLDPSVQAYGSWAAVMAAMARGEVVVDGSSVRVQHPGAGASSSEGAADPGSTSPEGR